MLISLSIGAIAREDETEWTKAPEQVQPGVYVLQAIDSEIFQFRAELALISRSVKRSSATLHCLANSKLTRTSPFSDTITS